MLIKSGVFIKSGVACQYECVLSESGVLIKSDVFIRSGVVLR